MSEPTGDLPQLLADARTGDQRALGRLLSIVGSSLADAACVALLLADLPRDGHAVGFVGPPGVGKSSLIAALIEELLSQDRRVAVLATDPTSAQSHGALLGDRVRMKSLSRDPRVFIRSVAARDPLRSLGETTLGAVALLTRIGFDYVLVEAVGAGQSDIGTSMVVDTTTLVLVPGLGDDVQAIKSGLIEFADVVVINKADLPDAKRMAKIVRQGIKFLDPQGSIAPPVVETSALKGTGLGKLVAALDERRQADDLRQDERKAQILLDLVLFEVSRRLRESLPDDPAVIRQVEGIARADTDVFRAALAVADAVYPSVG